MLRLRRTHQTPHTSSSEIRHWSAVARIDRTARQHREGHALPALVREPVPQDRQYVGRSRARHRQSHQVGEFTHGFVGGGHAAYGTACGRQTLRDPWHTKRIEQSDRAGCRFVAAGARQPGPLQTVQRVLPGRGGGRGELLLLERAHHEPFDGDDGCAVAVGGAQRNAVRAGRAEVHPQQARAGGGQGDPGPGEGEPSGRFRTAVASTLSCEDSYGHGLERGVEQCRVQPEPRRPALFLFGKGHLREHLVAAQPHLTYALEDGTVMQPDRIESSVHILSLIHIETGVAAGPVGVRAPTA